MLRNKEYLVKYQYQKSGNLRLRYALHETSSKNPEDFHVWVFKHFPQIENATVLELGTGYGRIWKINSNQINESWNIILTDISEGMIDDAKQELAELKPRFEFLTVDADHIPYSNNTFDLVIANHMLYHMPNINETLKEIIRVLKPSGTLICSTTGTNHMIEMTRIIKDNFASIINIRDNSTFTLENGAEILGRHFGDVSRFLYENVLEVKDRDLLLHYLVSVARDQSSTLLEETIFQISNILESIVVLGEDKPFYITSDTGLFVGKNPFKVIEDKKLFLCITTLREIIHSVGGVALNDWNMDIPLSDLGISSLKLYTLISQIEDAGKFNFKDEDLYSQNFKTIGSLCRLLKEYGILNDE